MPLLGLLLLVAGLCLSPMAETDLFFRLKVGDEILRAGALPRRNLFSFTFPDHPDLDPAWLFDVAAAGLYRLGGFPAVVLGKTALVVAIFAAAYGVCRRRGAAPAAAALALAAAAFVMRERLVERPHLFTLAGEVAVLAALAAPRRLWLLVPATALWANLHAGAFLGPLLLVLAFAGALLDTRGQQRQWRLPLLAAGCFAALLCTPVGPGLFRYLAFHRDIFAIHPVDEFRPSSWVSDAPLVLFALFTAGLALWARPRWRELLPVIGLGALAARNARFGADFALLAAPLVAVALTERASSLISRRRAGAVAGALLVALALVPRLTTHQRLAIGLDTEALPLEALRFVDDNGLRERMYNDFEIGAYLLWEGYPRHRVFVDPRLPAYPLSFHRLLGDPHLDRATWDAALDGFGVTSALVAYAGINHRISWWDPARWALVYRAHDARVFVRRLPRWRALIAAHEIPATFGFSVAEGATTVPLEAPPPGSPVPACEWQRRLGDLLFELGGQERALPAYQRALETPGCLGRAEEAEAAAWVGAVLLARDPRGALVLLDRALADQGAADLATLTNRALALEALGRRSEAAAAWSLVADRARGTPLGVRAAARARVLPR
jgi:tetratricopeptide (TPR) repeat protein